MKYGVYVIQDCGTGTKSMPFFAESDIVAKRQFAATLRTLPPSVRSDFSVFMLADYDDFTGEFVENKRGDIHVCNGADDDISKIMAMDASFYQRGNIDRAPVSKPEASNE